MSDTSLRYIIGLTLIPGIGAVTARKLIAYTGSAEAVFTEKKNALIKIPDIGEKIAAAITTKEVLSLADEEIEYAYKHEIRIFSLSDNDYPSRLKQCADSPLVLFCKGNVNLNSPKMLAIVGTRHSTSYGKDMTESIVADLAKSGQQIIIVSGLAFGIDITAHKAALKNNIPTVGIVAHGLDMLYPSSHRNVAHEMLAQGAVVSEFPTKTIPDKPLFVRRNRIIAGLTDATLVVESGITGGALITVEYANSYNRDVFAVPGRTNDNFSKGCNKLIRTNKAHLVESADDIAYILNWISADKKPSIQKQLFIDLNEDETRIMTLLREQHEAYIDEISFNTGMPVYKISSVLLGLELNGLIKSLPGKVYRAL